MAYQDASGDIAGHLDKHSDRQSFALIVQQRIQGTIRAVLCYKTGGLLGIILIMKNGEGPRCT